MYSWSSVVGEKVALQRFNHTW